jgi:surfactin synthase thioesterase subunit
VVNYNEVLDWRNHTSNNFSINKVDGDHFFIHTSSQFITSVISKSLNNTVNSPIA